MIAEKIILLLLLVFALFSVFATNLKRAIMGMSVFGLWMSFAYLFYHAPDVAISEAVIASSLGTILYIITIKKYNDISVQPRTSSLLKGILSSVLLIASCLLVINLTRETESVGTSALFELVMEGYAANGRTVSPVASIFFHYRVFDTIFEALMLLVSAIGVAHLLKPQGGTPRE